MFPDDPAALDSLRLNAAVRPPAATTPPRTRAPSAAAAATQPAARKRERATTSEHRADTSARASEELGETERSRDRGSALQGNGDRGDRGSAPGDVRGKGGAGGEDERARRRARESASVHELRGTGDVRGKGGVCGSPAPTNLPPPHRPYGGGVEPDYEGGGEVDSQKKDSVMRSREKEQEHLWAQATAVCKGGVSL